MSDESTTRPATHPDPLELMALLSTRLCHDMAGPVGAVANGAELMGGDPAMVDAEALDLLTSSAAGASIRLRTLRAAFGVAGAVEPGDMGRLLAAWSGPRCTIALPPRDTLAPLGAEALRLLLNLCLLALDGTIAPAALTVTAERAAPDVLRLGAAAEGRGPRAENGMAEALAGGAEGLGPRTVHGWIAGALARRLGGTAELAVHPSGCGLLVVLPQG